MKVWIFLLSVVVISCSTQPKAINYGSDKCSFCQMTIVDRQHASQIVTVKGKPYKYDAIECMMNDLKKWERPAPAELVVNDYDAPGEFINATEAYYLISEKIPSPMGAFLTAFSSSESRNAIEDEEGQELDWAGLKDQFEIEN